MTRRISAVLSFMVLFCFFFLGSASAKESVFAPQVNPSDVFEDSLPAVITVTAEIGDIPTNDIDVALYQTTAEGRVISIICPMFNDGTNGDIQKDSFYTGQFTISDASEKTIYLQVQANYKTKGVFYGPIQTVNILQPVSPEDGVELSDILHRLKSDFHKYAQTHDLDTARNMVLEDARKTPGISAANLSERNFSIIYKGMAGWLGLDDPNAPPVD